MQDRKSCLLSNLTLSFLWRREETRLTATLYNFPSPGSVSGRRGFKMKNGKWKIVKFAPLTDKFSPPRGA